MSVQPVSYFQFWSHARLTSPLFLVSFYLIFVALYFMSRILYQVAFGNMTLSSLLCFYIYYLITPKSHLLANSYKDQASYFLPALRPFFFHSQSYSLELLLWLNPLTLHVL